MEPLGLADLGKTIKAPMGQAYLQVSTNIFINTKHANHIHLWILSPGWRQQPWHLPWHGEDGGCSSSISKHFPLSKWEPLPLKMDEFLEILQTSFDPAPPPPPRLFVKNFIGQEDFVLTLHCEGENRLYPPKGKPFGCLPDKVNPDHIYYLQFASLKAQSSDCLFFLFPVEICYMPQIISKLF